MTLDQAIDIKSRRGEAFFRTDPNEVVQANKLSLEALRRIIQLRHTKDAYSWEPLPGETKE